MNIEFVRMCLKNAIDEVNQSAEVSDYMKQKFFSALTDAAIVLKKIERAKK
ncbi:MAG: hypothetical protein II088_08540 [Bacteroidales bacterium]|nr:hypothetical protein [Bacteroidales bacterium]MBQ1732546.1 hypothetical protein [Bacteroidales bacterium]